METAWLIVAFVVVVVAGALLARRLRIPSPLLLVLVGVLLSLAPFVPDYALNPEVVLMVILPPLLYSAAFNTSWIDLRAKKGTIASLSIGLVIATTLVVGLVLWWLLPALPLAAALALGAIVAPPDAVAATAIAKRVGMPKGIVQVLEGESLVNDATALTALRAALLALGGTVTVFEVGWGFLVAAGGGVIVGVLVALVYSPVAARLRSPVLSTPLTFVVPYLAFLVSEEINASGVVAVVVAGLYIGQQSPKTPSAASRLTAESNWRTIAFLLENGVFLLIGLQLTLVLRGVADSGLSTGTVVWLCLAAFVATVVVRGVWVFAAAALGRIRWFGRPPSEQPWPDTLVIAWAGMRGVVTLAAAFLLPVSIAYRSVLILIAFVIVIVSLLLEGATLPWLVRRLGLPGPDPRREALQEAALLERATRAGDERLAEDVDPRDPPQAVERLRALSDERRNFAWERLVSMAETGETPVEAYTRLRLRMLDAERKAVIRARDEGGYDDDVIRRVIRMFDVESTELSVRAKDDFDAEDIIVAPTAIVRGCEHLQRAREFGVPDALNCEGCVAEGTEWVHLRMCLTCGYRGCCDSSLRGHARRHFEETGHPVIRSIEPGEAWRWCYLDEEIG